MQPPTATQVFLLCCLLTRRARQGDLKLNWSFLQLISPFFFCAQKAWLSMRGRPCTTSSCAGEPSTCTGMSRVMTRPRTWRNPALAPGRSGCPSWLLGLRAPRSQPNWGHSPGPASVLAPFAPMWGPETTWAGTVTQGRWWSAWRRCS